MTDIQSGSLSAPQTIQQSIHTIPKLDSKGKDFNATLKEVEKEDAVKKVDEDKSPISYGVPNAYSEQVKQALQKVLGTDATKELGDIMAKVKKDPSQRVSELLMEMVDHNKKTRQKGNAADFLIEGSQGQTPRTGTNPALMNLPNIAPIKGQSLYPVPEGTPEAWVEPEWSADAVSTRIIQLAGFFMATLPGNPEENMKKIKDAMEKGFQNANDTIGAVPADLAQLYNNTYKQTMDKWDKFVGEFRDTQSKVKEESKSEASVELASASWTRPLGL